MQRKNIKMLKCYHNPAMHGQISYHLAKSLILSTTEVPQFPLSQCWLADLNVSRIKLSMILLPVPIAQVVERPLREREVAGSKPGRAIPKALKMVPMVTLLGAQHYKASTGFSHSLLTQLPLYKKKKKIK